MQDALMLIEKDIIGSADERAAENDAHTRHSLREKDAYTDLLSLEQSSDGENNSQFIYSHKESAGTQSLEQAIDAENEARPLSNDDLSPTETDAHEDMQIPEKPSTATDDIQSQADSHEVHFYRALPNT